jgi:3-deoxy-D-manno-octulosonic-acid transferase
MINFYDIAYGAGVAFSAPYWLTKSTARRKVLRAFSQRMGYVPVRESANPAILIHAVSLGEINATSVLVKLLQTARPDLHVIVSTTTDTGYDRGRQLYGSSANISLIRFPLDFTTAINRLFNAINPSLVVLMEGELWPNFLRQCRRREIPVALVNGRITTSAFDRYKLIRPIAAGMLRSVQVICAQDEIYARRFIELGALNDCVRVTGTMKFDTAQVSDRVDGDDQLAIELGLSFIAGGGSPGLSTSNGPGLPPPANKDPLWVCGSTGPGEESIILDAYFTLRTTFPTLRLVIVPRHPQRFDEVAKIITDGGFPLLRRSARTSSTATDHPIILGDTMGELRKFYSLADVVFVGRTLVDLGPRQHGSDMIEPAALAKPIAIGPWTHNFAEPMSKFRQAKAIVEVTDVGSLIETITGWLKDPSQVVEIGRRAQAVVRENQGATTRHAGVILENLKK